VTNLNKKTMSKDNWVFHKKITFTNISVMGIKSTYTDTIIVNPKSLDVNAVFPNDSVELYTDISPDILVSIETAMLKDHAAGNISNLLMTDAIVLTIDEDGNYKETPITDN